MFDVRIVVHALELRVGVHCACALVRRIGHLFGAWHLGVELFISCNPRLKKALSN